MTMARSRDRQTTPPHGDVTVAMEMEVDPSKLTPAADPSLVGTLRYPLLTHEKVGGYAFKDFV